MVAPKARKLKTITFTLGGTSFEQQLKSWTLTNNTDTGISASEHSMNAQLMCWKNDE